MASFFDAIGGLFTGQNLAVAAVLGIPTLLSAQMSSSANVQAAKIASDAAIRQADEIRRGNEMAQSRFEELRTVAEPGVARLQTIVASPSGLTPEQIAERDELRRQSANTVSRSGLRGSGRATVSAINKVESDYTNKAMAANRQRGDAAAGTLAQSALSSYGSQAGIDQSSGRAAGEALMKTGMFDAGATQANATITGKAMGDIAGVIASDIKGRESKYGDRLRTIESDLYRRRNETESLGQDG